jgi:hypothetical protein
VSFSAAFSGGKSRERGGSGSRFGGEWAIAGEGSQAEKSFRAFIVKLSLCWGTGLNLIVKEIEGWQGNHKIIKAILKIGRRQIVPPTLTTVSGKRGQYRGQKREKRREQK